MTISHPEVNQMVQAEITKAQELDVHLGVATVDSGRDIVGFNRREGTTWVTATVAQGMAIAAFGF